ncbi:MAG: ribose-phosphate pyrophosphokinase [Candidatus Bathyarchaeia archaeon]
MKVVGGPSSLGLSARVAGELGVPSVKVAFKRFPDGEFYFKYEEEVADEDLLLVQSLYPPQEQHLFELLAMSHAAKDLGARSVVAYVPYLAYSRQNRRFLNGEAVTSTLVAQLLERAGIDALYTVDVHNKGILSRYTVPAVNLTAADELARYFTARDLKRPLLVAPDDEADAQERVKTAAEAVGGDHVFLEKRRDRRTGQIVTEEKKVEAAGRDAIIIDDIISTGHTAANAARLLKKMGALRVFVGVTHAMPTQGTLGLLREAGVDEAVSTDSIPCVISRVSTASILVRALRTG